MLLDCSYTVQCGATNHRSFDPFSKKDLPASRGLDRRFLIRTGPLLFAGDEVVLNVRPHARQRATSRLSWVPTPG
jgi:hypothetical protein